MHPPALLRQLSFSRTSGARCRTPADRSTLGHVMGSTRCRVIGDAQRSSGASATALGGPRSQISTPHRSEPPGPLGFKGWSRRPTTCDTTDELAHERPIARRALALASGRHRRAVTSSRAGGVAVADGSRGLPSQCPLPSLREPALTPSVRARPHPPRRQPARGSGPRCSRRRAAAAG